MNLPNLNYVQISDTPSAIVQKVLDNEDTLKAGQSYLALGFVCMGSGIVLVDSDGAVVTLPYDEDSFIFE